MWIPKDDIKCPTKRAQRESLERRLPFIIWKASSIFYTALFGAVLPGDDLKGYSGPNLNKLPISLFRRALLQAFPLDPHKTTVQHNDIDIVLLILTIIITSQDVLQNGYDLLVGRLFWTLFNLIGRTHGAGASDHLVGLPVLRHLVEKLEPVFTAERMKHKLFSKDDFNEAKQCIFQVYMKTCSGSLILEDNEYVKKVFVENPYDPKVCVAPTDRPCRCLRVIADWGIWFTVGGGKGTEVMRDIEIPLCPIRFQDKFGHRLSVTAWTFERTDGAAVLCEGCKDHLWGRFLAQDPDVMKLIYSGIEGSKTKTPKFKGAN